MFSYALIAFALVCLAGCAEGFGIHGSVHKASAKRVFSVRFMSEPETPTETEVPIVGTSDPMEEATMDAEERLNLEKARRSKALRDQEVFMKKSTGKYSCSNCDWVYDEEKGDAMMIGGMIQPGTLFSELPSNWRCPVCRASKDSFAEQVVEIPGFEVNQGYGFGGNAMTGEQKTSLIFGGLFFFFLLFLSGYALN